MAPCTSLVLLVSVSLFILCDAPEKGFTSVISFLIAHCLDTASPTIESKLSPGQRQEAPSRMRTGLNALESPISKCKQNLRNCSSPSGGPRDQPLKLSKNPPRGPIPYSAVSGILGQKIELVNSPSCVCIGIGFSVVSQIHNLGHNSLR